MDPFIGRDTGVPRSGNHDNGPNASFCSPSRRFETPEALLARMKEASESLLEPYIPLNGPPGAEGLTYSFTHKNALFAVSINTGTTAQDCSAWLERQFAGNKKTTYFRLG
jgi:hypothetical protein